MRNHFLPPASGRSESEMRERETLLRQVSCPACGGYLHEDDARMILYGGPSDGDTASWVSACDCPGPYSSSACEVNPF